ncbi:MAG: hypothetical protein HYY63_00675 [Elusimicrobia bacterium]|nr:hypothetical protein [Elusimicrobiota bacterium]
MRKSLWIVLGLGMGLSQNLFGLSLSGSMGELLIRNLQPGTTVQLTPLMRLPWRIQYEGKEAIQLILRPAVPDGVEEMKTGYEVIPDLSWVRLSPALFDLEKSSTVASDVSISIPNDDSLLGKKFVVYLWAQTAAKKAGVSTGLGVKGRLLLTIAPERKKISDSLNTARSYMEFKLRPETVLLQGIQPGKKIALNKVLKKKFVVENFGSETMKFSVNRISGDSLGMNPTQGMEWGPRETVCRVQPAALKIKPGKKKHFTVTIQIPDEEQNYNRRFQYLFRISPSGVGVKSGILLKVNMETSPK